MTNFTRDDLTWLQLCDGFALWVNTNFTVRWNKIPTFNTF